MMACLFLQETAVECTLGLTTLGTPHIVVGRIGRLVLIDLMTW